MLNYEHVIIDCLFDCCFTSSEQYVSATCIFMTKTSIKTVNKVNIWPIPLSPLMAKCPLYLFISSCGKMTTLPLCPLMTKCPLYPIISPYGKMLTLSHDLPLWQSKYLSVSPSYCHIFTLFTVEWTFCHKWR
jgi:hypothetical protein